MSQPTTAASPHPAGRRLAWRWLLLVALLAVVAAPDAARAQTTSQERHLLTITDDLSAYWSGVYKQYGFKYDDPRVKFATGNLAGPCQGEANVAAYCPEDATVYLEADQLDALAKRFGPIVEATAISHEWGHHLMFLLLQNQEQGVDLTRLRDSAAVELLADCLSGVYIGHLWYSFRTQDGDVTDAVDVLSRIGDPTHGSGDDRIVSFMAGFVKGFSGCDILK